ncbi:hypothetical protein [Streptomyces sp. NPDC098781]|uniref:hypothetical protein n=1 Tax=Streptomyces sp. NPDC098781 TaxID=3366097 RepID=UPI0037F53857
MPAPPTTALMWDVIERYFDLLQAHVPAEQMLAEVLTDDFRTGFVDGLVWEGEHGLREFLAARSDFFDESHTIEQLDVPEELSDGRWRVRTRLEFFLRHRPEGAPASDSYTGKAFHAWDFQPAEEPADWRVAAQMVEGFAQLNENAQRLFSRPAGGLQTDES